MSFSDMSGFSLYKKTPDVHPHKHRGSDAI